MGTENIIMPRYKYAMEVSGLPYQRVNEVSDTQKYGIGARYHEAISGRVYYYGRSENICYASRGVASVGTIAQGITYGLLSGEQQIGDRQATMAAATHDSFAEDELQGGLFSVALAANKRQDLIISGNDAVAADLAVTVYFTEPLHTATDATLNAYVSPNPYYELRTGVVAGDENMNFAIMGVPGAYVSAAGKFFWVQTWGPCYVDAGNDWQTRTFHCNEAAWHYDGTIHLASFAQPVAHTYVQRAGFGITRAGRRTINLQINP